MTLMRWAYDYETDDMQKVYDKFTFPVEIDMSPYMVELSDADQKRLAERNAQDAEEDLRNKLSSQLKKRGESGVVSKEMLEKALREEEHAKAAQQASEPLYSSELMEAFPFVFPKSSLQLAKQNEDILKGQSHSSTSQSSLSTVKRPPSPKGNRSYFSYKQQTPGLKGSSSNNIYVLHSVLVHSGGAHRGHYYSYIQPKCDGKWFSFDDDDVELVDQNEAVDDNFGGYYRKAKSNRLVPYMNSAYMLVYIKKDLVPYLLRDVSISSIPRHIHQSILEIQERKTRIAFRLFTDSTLFQKMLLLLISEEKLKRLLILKEERTEFGDVFHSGKSPLRLLQ